MQVFIIGTPLETAMALDPLRLNKQIIECQQILDALNGKKAWSRHPAVLQYRGHEEWLAAYALCLEAFASKRDMEATIANAYAGMCTPEWHCEEYYINMKRRLFEKDELHYKQWSFLGKSLDNWYYIDGKFVKYRNGKRIA
jgi:hypothetical protein